eukprot:1731230-Pyramimonas_sp.AAC.1
MTLPQHPRKALDEAQLLESIPRRATVQEPAKTSTSQVGQGGVSIYFNPSPHQLCAARAAQWAADRLPIPPS